MGSHNHHLYQDVKICMFPVCVLLGDWQILCIPQECADNQALRQIPTFLVFSSFFLRGGGVCVIILYRSSAILLVIPKVRALLPQNVPAPALAIIFWESRP